MKRLAKLHQRSVKDLDRVAAGIVELEDLEHAAFLGFFVGTETELDSGVRELTLHLGEFFGAGNAETEVCEIVTAVIMDNDPMMQVVHA